MSLGAGLEIGFAAGFGAEAATPVWLLLLLAPAAGSFLAVLADRLPRGEDVLLQRSACRSCGQRLGAADLVPLLSFVLTRGHCRHCGAAVPPWLLYFEIAATGAAVLALAAGGSAAAVLLSCLFLWLLLTLATADLLWLRLPDVLTGGLFALVLLMGLQPGAGGLGAVLGGAALGAGSFLALRLGYRALRGREGLGLGDVKLMAGLGGFAGAIDLPLLLLLASGGALAAAWLPQRRLRGGMELPFGAALCAAAAVLWLLRAAGGV